MPDQPTIPQRSPKDEIDDMHRRHATKFSRNQSSDASFDDSIIIAAVTDSAVAGTVLGGDVVGAIIGDALDGDLED